MAVGYIVPKSEGRFSDGTLTFDKGTAYVHIRSSKDSKSNCTISYFKTDANGGLVQKGQYFLEPGEARDYGVNNQSNQRYDVIKVGVPADAYVDYDYL